MAQITAAVVTTNPFSTGAGARTSPKSDQAAPTSSPTARTVSAVGRPHIVVSGKRVQAMNRTAATTVVDGRGHQADPGPAQQRHDEVRHDRLQEQGAAVRPVDEEPVHAHDGGQGDPAQRHLGGDPEAVGGGPIRGGALTGRSGPRRASTGSTPSPGSRRGRTGRRRSPGSPTPTRPPASRPCGRRRWPTRTTVTIPNRWRSRAVDVSSSSAVWPTTSTRAPWPSRWTTSIIVRRLALPEASTTARCSSRACRWGVPDPKPESAPSVVTRRTRSRRALLADTMLAAADTAASSDLLSCAARRTSSSTVVRPCHGCSCWRTSSSSCRAVDGQWMRRRSSPTT